MLRGPFLLSFSLRVYVGYKRKQSDKKPFFTSSHALPLAVSCSRIRHVPSFVVRAIDLIDILTCFSVFCSNPSTLTSNYLDHFVLYFWGIEKMASYVLCQPINYMLKYFKYFIYKCNRHVATKKTIFFCSQGL